MEKYNFNSLFAKTKGQPIKYNGKTLYLSYNIQIKYKSKILVTLEKTNSHYIQGIGIMGGHIVFGTKQRKSLFLETFTVPPNKRFFKRKALPFSYEVTCNNKKNVLHIYNVALVKNRQEYWTNGCAMIVNEIDNGYRFMCNDFQFNDDFNDIIFKVEYL